MGFYILFYIIPLLIPLYIVAIACNNLVMSNGTINLQLIWVVIVCTVIVTTWTTFFLIYFTKARTNNPRLYGKVFISDFKTTTETSDSTRAKSKQEQLQ
jgi:hypothetical protein